MSPGVSPRELQRVHSLSSTPSSTDQSRIVGCNVQKETRARVLGAAARGGLRIDGGLGGFAERTVSLVDLAWVVVAADDVATMAALLTKPRVNRLRYLEGVPKGSTRWIDTGWAISAWQATKDNV